MRHARAVVRVRIARIVKGLVTLGVCLGAALATSEPARAGGRSAAGLWRLGPDGAAIFDVVDDPDAAKGGLSLPGHYIVYATEIAESGTVGAPAHDLAEIVTSLVFRLPTLAPERAKRFQSKVELPRTAYGDVAGVVVGKRGRDGALRARWEVASRGGNASTARLEKCIIDVSFDLIDAAPGVKRGDFRVEAVTRTAAAGAGGSQATDVFAQGELRHRRDADLRASAFSDAVRASIEKGKAWLLRNFKSLIDAHEKASPAPNHSMGHVALRLFALLRSGLSPDDPIVERAFAYLDRLPFVYTYDTALYIMCLEARRVTREEANPESGYTTVARYRRGQVPQEDLEKMAKAADWLLAARNPGQATWWYKGLEAPERPKTSNPGDHSNTQFAILALHAAERSGVRIPTGVWEEVANHFINTQESTGPTVKLRVQPLGATPVGDPEAPPAEGETRERARPRSEVEEALVTSERGARKARGWAYGLGRVQTDVGYGSMSSAGVSSLAIALESLEKNDALSARLRAKLQPAIDDGLAWLQLHYTPRTNGFKGNAWFYYYLYSVEKAGELALAETFGFRAWWAEAALGLIETQHAEGHWNAKNPNDTAFSLLFLNRATIPAKIIVEKPGGVATGADAEKKGAGPGGLDDQVFVEGMGLISLSQAISTLETGDAQARRQNLAVVKKCFETLEPRRRPVCIPALVGALRSRDKAVRKFAAAALGDATGDGGKLEAAEAEQWYHTWSQVVEAGAARDHSRVSLLRGTLRARDASEVLKQAVLEALGRMRAVEATGEVIEELQSRDEDHRKFAWNILLSLAGREVPFDPSGDSRSRGEAIEAWREWWNDNRAELLQRAELKAAWAKVVAYEESKRASPEGGEPGKAPKKDYTFVPDPPEVAAAVERLTKAGRASVPYLIAGLGDEVTRGRAIELLEEVTDERHGEDVQAWRTWWETAGGE